MKKGLSILLALCIVFAAVPVMASAGLPAIDLAAGSITIENGTTGGTLKVTYGGEVVDNIAPSTTINITQTNAEIPTASSIVIKADITEGVNIKLSGVNIQRSSGNPVLAIDPASGKVNLILADGSDNILKGPYNCAGLQKNNTDKGAGGLLAISCERSSESGHTCNGTCGKLTATGGGFGAGIGGGNNGAGSYIDIFGGNITATGSWAAGIGGGGDAAGSHINIYGGIIDTSGSFSAGIGGGSEGTGSNITISGGIVSATGSSGGAGIGGGYKKDGSHITISGSIVKATGGNGGAGIGGGGGYYDSSSGNVPGGKGSNITISGGTVIAKSTLYGNDIGGGGFGGAKADSSNIVITGGNINASTIGITPKNNSGTAVYKATFSVPDDTVGGITLAALSFTSKGTPYSYNTNDTSSILYGGAGKLFIYLPVGTYNTLYLGETYKAEVNTSGTSIFTHVLIGTVTDLNLTDRLAAPTTGGTPVTTITDDQYTGTVTWSDNPTKFLGNTTYTATITLTAKDGYTFSSVAQDAFSYTGATSVTNLPGSDQTLTVTIVFPQTAAEQLFTVTVTNGTGSGSYAESATVTITANDRSGYTFTGWSGAGVTFADAAAKTTTFTMPAKAVTVTANYRQNSSGNNGSSTPSNNSTITIIPPTAAEPDRPTQGEIKVPCTLDDKGNATVEVTEKDITDVFDKALAEAKKNGNEKNGISLILRLNTGSKAVTGVTVNLPKVVQDLIISNKIVSTMVVVDNPDIRIDMDLATVKEINKQAKSDVHITAGKGDIGKLTGMAKAAIGSRPVFDLKVNYGSGKQVQDFGTGSVSVAIPYTLGAKEKAGNVQAVYIDETGKVHWLTGSVYDSVNKVLRFSTNHFSTYGVGYLEEVPAFTDIRSHWAKDDITFVVSRGLFSGTSETTFGPNAAMTRGMFVTVLGRLANADVNDYKQSSFSDVKNNTYYMGCIEWASKNHIVSGIGEGKFAPNQPITRQQMAVIMSNYAKAMGIKLSQAQGANTFADSAKINAYAKEAVKQMEMAGVISGKKGNIFDPRGTATRAEVSAVLSRFLLIPSGTDSNL